MGVLWILLSAGYLEDKGMPALPIGGLDALGEAQGLTVALSLELLEDKDKDLGACRAYALKDGAWELWIDATVVGPPAPGASACMTIDGLPELGFKPYTIDGLPELGF